MPTRWSLIAAARTRDESRRQEVIAGLAERYWRPVYCFIRRRGYDEDNASDLTQGFFCEIVLDGELIQRADRTRGRFRTLLLTALQRYLVTVQRRRSASTRRPEGRLRSLEAAALPDLPTTRWEMRADDAFYYAWAADLLGNVLAELKYEYAESDKEAYWTVFRRRVLAPIMEGTQAPSLSEVCREYGISDESRASNMIVTAKRRFRAILRREIRRLVRSDAEVEAEFQEIFEILSRGCAR